MSCTITREILAADTQQGSESIALHAEHARFCADCASALEDLRWMQSAAQRHTVPLEAGARERVSATLPRRAAAPRWRPSRLALAVGAPIAALLVLAVVLLRPASTTLRDRVLDGELIGASGAEASRLSRGARIPSETWLQTVDGARLAVGPATLTTRASLIRLGGSTVANDELLLERGQLSAEVEHLPAGSTFSIRTRQVTLQVVGTRFVVRATPGRTEVEVVEGTVWAWPADGAAQLVMRAGARRSFPEHTVATSAAAAPAAPAVTRALPAAESEPSARVPSTEPAATDPMPVSPQPTLARPLGEKTALDRPALDKAALDKAALDKPALDGPALDKAGLARPALDRTTPDPTALDETARTEPAPARAAAAPEAPPELPIATRPSAAELMARADRERRSGRVAEAAESYRRLLEHPSGQAYAEEAALQRASLLLQLAERPGARATLEAAASRFPRGPLEQERTALLARSWFEEGDLLRAAAVLEHTELRLSLELARLRIELAQQLFAREPALAKALARPVAASTAWPKLRAEAQALLMR